MNPALLRVAASTVTSGAGRRLLGCGCLGVAAMAAMPLALIAAVSAGALPVPISTGAVAAAGRLVIGSAEPLPAGSFRVSQGFGCTTVGVEGRPPSPYVCPPDTAHATATRFHTGIDLAAAGGVPVYAVAAGVVRVVADDGGFGLHAVLDAGDSVSYLYGHLSTTVVADGSAVSAGTLIGFVGSTGNSTGPHLHFEVDVGGVPTNPCPVFPPGYLSPPGTAGLDCLAADLRPG